MWLKGQGPDVKSGGPGLKGGKGCVKGSPERANIFCLVLLTALSLVLWLMPGP